MKNLANFKVAVKTREYLIQAIFQMLFSNQEASEIINQFKNEHQDKKVDFAMFTKSLNSILLNLGLDRGLIIFDKISENVQLAARNLEGIEVVNADLVNTYQILRHKQILVTKEAMNLLIARVVKKDVEE